MRGWRTLTAVVAALLLGAHLAEAQKQGQGSPLLPGGDAHAPVNVSADRLEYFSKERKAIYLGHVVARQGEGSLRAKSLTIYFGAGPTAAPGGFSGAGGSQVTRMNAAGPVTIAQKDEIGVGDSASYVRADNQVVLTGNVSLTQGPDVVKGDRLVYDLATGQAQVVGRVTSLFIPGTGGVSDAKSGRPDHRKKRATASEDQRF